MKGSWKSYTLGAWAAWILVMLGYFYLAPASGLALLGDTSRLLSEGGDANSAPFHHWVIQRLLHERPSFLLYGAVHTDQLNPTAGFGLWIPWIERIISGSLGGFFTVEGLSTAYPWALMLLNGFLVYLFGKREGWPWSIALAAGICFAFNPFTRARSIAHDSLVGNFYIPAIFLGLQALRRGEGAKKTVEAALWLLLAVTSAHYYIMMSIALVPFLLWYALRGRNPKGRAFARLVAAGVPAVLFLGWNLLAPLPREVAAEQAMHRPAIASYWLVTFAARPIDYLTGDIAFDASDWNPLRASLTRGVRDARYDSSNNIERANGIRWSVLVITLVATVAVLRKRRQKSLPEPVRWELVFFVALAAGAYWLSLSPRSFAPGGIGMGPSLWVHKLLPHFRVPSRFGPVVHFACLVIAGYALTAWLARSKSRPFRTGILVLAPFVAVLEFLPLHPVWAIAAQPDRAELVLPGTNYCGTGVFFPYVGIRPGSLEEFDYYKTIQQMKRTSCILGNIPLDDPRNAAFYAKIGTDRFASAPAATASALVEFLKCSGFEWVVFRDEASPGMRAKVCSDLGWKRVSDDSCRNPDPSRTPVRIAECL